MSIQSRCLLSKRYNIVAAILLLALMGTSMFFLLKAVMAQKAVAGIVETAETLADSANYEDAILKIQEGLVEYPDSDDLKDKLDVYTTSLTEQNICAIITEANDLASQGDLEAAAEKIEEGLAIYPDSASLQSEQTEYNHIFAQVKANAISVTSQLAQHGNYLSAIEGIWQALHIIGEDSDLSVMLQGYKDGYAADAITQATALADQKDLDGAIDILMAAEEEIGANSEIDANIGILTLARKHQQESPKVALDVPNYMQTDSRWSSIYIGSDTIKNVGCFLTSLAMKYSYSTGEEVYPNVMLSKLSFMDNAVYWSSVESLGYTHVGPYSIYMTNSLMQMIYTQLKAGTPVIIGAQNGSGKNHYVIITGYTGASDSIFSASDFTINDPNANLRTTLAQLLRDYPVVMNLIY